MTIHGTILRPFRKRVIWFRQWWPSQRWERRAAFVALAAFALASDSALLAIGVANFENLDAELRILAIKVYLSAFIAGGASLGTLLFLASLCAILPVLRRNM